MDSAVKAISDTFEELHSETLKAVEPLGDEQINWVHPQLSNTIGVLLRHLAGSERYWIGEVVGGRSVGRQREAEFAHEPLKKDPLVQGLRETYAATAQLLQRLTADHLREEIEITYRGSKRKVTKQWAMLHMMHHCAYHLGQIQLFKKMASSVRAS